MKSTPPTQLDYKIEEVGKCAYPIESINVEDTNFNDLAFLDTILNNNRIIFLGEQLHGDGTTFEAKARLIRYLHEKLGYNTLLYEAGLYDMWLLNEQFYDRRNVVELNEQDIPSIGLYPFWWKNIENKKLWDYFRKEKEKGNPISFGGFDIQLTGTISKKIRYDILKTYLVDKGISLDKYKSISKTMEKCSNPTSSIEILHNRLKILYW